MQAAASQARMLAAQQNGRHTPCQVPWRRKAILSASRAPVSSRPFRHRGGREERLASVYSLADTTASVASSFF